MDCDIYSSTVTILDELNQLIPPGCIILFDDLYPFHGEQHYPNWKDGEFKAINEWLDKYDRKIEVIASCQQFFNSVVKVIK